VTPFPSVVALHPGWYEESEMSMERLEAEAGAVLGGVKERAFFVLSPATRAGRALLGELIPAGGTRVAAAGPFELWILGPDEGRGRQTGPGGPS
jgi:hypothetical protein